MDKEELRQFINAKMLANVAGFSYGYSHGELQLNNPAEPVTQQQFFSMVGALQMAIIDALEALGLVDDSKGSLQ
jgi:hypothetical protein